MVGKKSESHFGFSKAFLSGADMSSREEEILKELVSLTDLEPEEVLHRSSYWGTSKTGAVSYRGVLQGKPAVLKIQGVKPEVSEIYMLEEFKKRNKSKVIRPPDLYFKLPWEEKRGYEALIVELAQGEKVVKSGKPVHLSDIKEFYELYLEYRKNCRRDPWVNKPEKRQKVSEAIEELLKIAEEKDPSYPWKKPDDANLVRKAAGLVDSYWGDIDLEFVHKHFSVEDLIRQGREIILTSNLTWGWKQPYYDGVFGYHWLIITLGRYKKISESVVEGEREKWLKTLFSLPLFKNEKDLRLAKVALLERAAAALALDVPAYTDPDGKAAPILMNSARKEVTKLIKELSS